jgi:hypothetical protein
VVKRTISRLEENRRGIILLHDIQPATALALPNLLKELKARGYRVVLVKPAAPTAELVASAKPLVAPKAITADRAIVPPLTPTVPRPAPIIAMGSQPAPGSEVVPEATQANAAATAVPRVVAKPALAPVVKHMEQAALPTPRSYEHLAKPFTPRLKPYRSTELAAKPPFEPAPGPVRTQQDRESSLRGPVVSDKPWIEIPANAQASASPADLPSSPPPAAAASQLKPSKIAEPTGDLGMWPFEPIGNVTQSTLR